MLKPSKREHWLLGSLVVLLGVQLCCSSPITRIRPYERFVTDDQGNPVPEVPAIARFEVFRENLHGTTTTRYFTLPAVSGEEGRLVFGPSWRLKWPWESVEPRRLVFVKQGWVEDSVLAYLPVEIRLESASSSQEGEHLVSVIRTLAEWDVDPDEAPELLREIENSYSGLPIEAQTAVRAQLTERESSIVDRLRASDAE